MAALGIDPILIIVYIINFGLVLFALQRLAFKPVQEMLAKRRQEIESGLSAAERAQQEAAQQRAEFERELGKARQTSQEEARKAAEATEKMRQDILAAAQREAEEIKTRAREEADQERQQVAADLQKQASELAMQIARKIVGEAVDENAQRKLLNKFLTDLGETS
jgi:F-type H+-transporting ATPase subunit b